METTASAHFKNYNYSDLTKKHYMTCIYCNKVLIDSKNSTCKVSHLFSCRPDKAMLLRNKLKNFTQKPAIQIKFGEQSTEVKFIVIRVKYYIL